MNFFDNHDPYSNLSCVYNVTNYVLRDKAGQGNAMNRFSGGMNVFDLSKAGEEFMQVKRYYGKMFGRHIKHFYITFDKDEPVMPELAYILAYHISMFYRSRFQVVFSVHEETDNLHIHFAINTVSFIDGKKLHEGMEELYALEIFCRDCYKALIKSRTDE